MFLVFAAGWAAFGKKVVGSSDISDLVDQD